MQHSSGCAGLFTPSSFHIDDLDRIWRCFQSRAAADLAVLSCHDFVYITRGPSAFPPGVFAGSFLSEDVNKAANKLGRFGSMPAAFCLYGPAMIVRILVRGDPQSHCRYRAAAESTLGFDATLAADRFGVHLLPAK